MAGLRTKERGVSLLVVLLLLLIMTLLGLAVLRSTLLQERMSGNMYDRSLGFQSAEIALRSAEKVIQDAASHGTLVGVNCSAIDCPAVPANTYTGGNGTCPACWVSVVGVAQENSPGPSQYYIQYIGQRTSEDQLSLGSSANQNQYGGSGGTTLENYYRVIARSNDPALASASGRAVVVLQSNVTIK